MIIVGENNSIIISRIAKLENTNIIISGNDNKIIISDNCLLVNLDINITGNNHTFKIDNNSAIRGGKIDFEDNGNTFSVGIQTDINADFYAALCENNKSITIGNNCLFSNTVRMRVSDSHPIVDMNTEELLNSGKDIVLKDRIWICEYVHIFKGANIGSDSVIGSGSIVTGKIFPDHCVIAGNPAKVIKTNISWKHLRILEE